jgi:hypothetical protein
MRKGLAVSITAVLAANTAAAHGVAGGDQAFLMASNGLAPAPFLYLGAKHMITGYDHVLYLAGVIFFLNKLGDVAKFVSLFALGHSITLLFGVLSGLHVSAYFIDAVIGLSICYKALENLQIIRWMDARLAVFGFGLIHGFGLSSKLQDLSLSRDGLIGNMVFFNIGVEVGQGIALGFLFALFNGLRQLRSYDGIAQYCNIGLFGAGLVLFGFQATGLYISWR